MAALERLKPWNAANLRKSVESALDQADYQRALSLIRDAISHAMRSAGRYRQLSSGSPELDELCFTVGSRIAASTPRKTPVPPLGNDNPLDLFVASEIYAVGGHTALIGSYMANLGGRRRLLAVTDLSNRPRQFFAEAWPRLGIPPDEVTTCAEPTLEGKCRWLMGLLAEQRPDRVFLFTHPHDSPAIAACQPLWGSRFYFVHHVDRAPSLGAFGPACTHVDVTPFCFRCCGGLPGLRENIYLPIVVADQGARDFSQPRNSPLGLLTASCGSSSKFQLDRSDLYIRAVAAILGTTKGRHLHIGSLTSGQLFLLQASLREFGVEPERFQHIPFTRSLWQTLGDQSVDLYIGSMPHRGAMASVEAMGSATPAIWHLSSERSRLHDLHMKYPEAAVWSDAAGLVRLIRAIDAPWLRRQSVAARRHYEHYHHPSILSRQLALPLVAGTMPQDNADLLDEPKPIDLEELPASWRDKFNASIAANSAFWRGNLLGRRSR
jgi:hypothetical protein